MALVHEIRALNSSSGPTGVFFSSMARQSLTSILKAIVNVSHYWAGVDPIVDLLAQRGSGSTIGDAVLTRCRLRRAETQYDTPRDIHHST